MRPAFWDTSALVPLCVEQQQSETVRKLLTEHRIAVWWGTPVEMRSAFERLVRMGHLPDAGNIAAGLRLEELRRKWRELQPSQALRFQAEALLAKYLLRGADALQLAAEYVWAMGAPRENVFVSADGQLLHAARREGFVVFAV